MEQLLNTKIRKIDNILNSLDKLANNSACSIKALEDTGVSCKEMYDTISLSCDTIACLEKLEKFTKEATNIISKHLGFAAASLIIDFKVPVPGFNNLYATSARIHSNGEFSMYFKGEPADIRIAKSEDGSIRPFLYPSSELVDTVNEAILFYTVIGKIDDVFVEKVENSWYDTTVKLALNLIKEQQTINFVADDLVCAVSELKLAESDNELEP